ncbi:MAG: polysaccharide deacetylase family protein [Conexibacteraceae bacterium]|nr:polysaccharide deacetylase family protein [Conexibacteraceae bacterium]
MLRHVFAMHVPAFARALGLARTLDDLGPATAPLLASGPAGVAITFDDGPHPDGTPLMLEVLARHEAHATFFLVGEQVARRPQLARRIAAEGHTIGLHGHLHRPHPTRSASELERDYERALAVIADATGVAPRLHRPPFGIYSPTSLRMARERGLQPLLWSRWGKDWRKFTTPPEIARRVLGGVAAGDVILLHDADFYSAKRSHYRTAEALPEILAKLKSGGLGTVGAA